MAVSLLGAAERTAPTAGRSAFRPDIQGLRSVAVIAVLLYHLGVPFVPGGFVGVDVFFVISGFLITGLLLRQLVEDGRVSLVGFYARRARRLLPAATLVLVVTAALTAVLLPVTRWASIGWDLIASASYVQNWRLAADSVDYLTSDAAPGPLQHYWSLAVEEQFYLVWPLLLIAAGGLLTGKRRRRGPIPMERLRPLLLVALTLVLLPSLAWSIHYTATAPGPAYFASTTRFWQLALGALLAVAVAQLERLPHAVATIAGWAGMGGIIASAVLIDGSVPYPGSAALIPTVSSALVIAAGVGRAPLGPGLVLGTRPMTFLGDISYSLYLWHWPLIVLATAVVGEPDAVTGTVIAGLSIGLAYLTYTLVEKPVSGWSAFRDASLRGVCTGLVLMVVGGIAGGLLVTAVRTEVDRAEAVRVQVQTVLHGARTLPANPRSAGFEPQATAEDIAPMPVVAAKDFPTCDSAKISETEIVSCEYGERASDIHVALVGDSHAKQWIPALEKIAQERGWRLTAYIHDACPFATGELERKGRVYTTCMDWNGRMQDLLQEDPLLSMVITSSYTVSAGISGATDDVAAMSEAFRRSWSTFTRNDIPVAVIRDTPAPGFDVPECVAANTAALGECSAPRGEAADDKGLAQMAGVRGLPGATLIDLNDFICPADECPPVIGDVLVYRDGDHLTATYVRSLSSRLAPPLDALLDVP